MYLKHLFSSFLLADLAAANVMRRGVDCSYFVQADSSQTCDSLARQWGMNVQQFEKLNPGVDCPYLVAGQNYCVLGSITTDKPTTTSVSHPTTKPSTSSHSSTQRVPHTTSTSANPYSPTQSGLATNCNNYHQVKSSDQCNTIEKQYDISEHQFLKWNPSINNGTDPPKPTPEYILLPISARTLTNTPLLHRMHKPLGIAPNCDSYHKVVSGDQCNKIESEYKITNDEFIKWNPSINSTCNNLWVGYYVCVHVPGVSTAPTTPQPLMPGVVSGCKRFHKIASGESCYTIDQQAGITLNQFRSWNKNTNADCTNLWAGYYVCVGH